MSSSSAVQKAVWRTLGTDDWEVAFESPTRLCLELANERRLRGPVGVEAPERDVAQQAISCDVAVLNLGPIFRCSPFVDLVLAVWHLRERRPRERDGLQQTRKARRAAVSRRSVAQSPPRSETHRARLRSKLFAAAIQGPFANAFANQRFSTR